MTRIISARLVITDLIFSREPRLYKRVCPSVGRLVGFFIGQKWAETLKNEIRDDEAGRDYTSHDLFRVYELVC